MENPWVDSWTQHNEEEEESGKENKGKGKGNLEERIKEIYQKREDEKQGKDSNEERKQYWK